VVSTIPLMALLVIPLWLGGTVEGDDVWRTRVLVMVPECVAVDLDVVSIEVFDVAVGFVLLELT
jgi:hypothetical protein